MEMNSADASAGMPELCDEIYSDYLPECGLRGDSESWSESVSEHDRKRIDKSLPQRCRLPASIEIIQ